MTKNRVIPTKGPLKILRTLDLWLQKILKVVAMVCLAVVVCVVFMQIFSRTVFDHSFRWVDEIARWTNIYSALCGGALCYRLRGLTSFDACVDRLKMKYKIGLRYINDVLIASLCIGVIAGGVKLMKLVMTYHQTAAVTGIPMAVPYFVIILTFGSILLFSINMIVFGACGVDDGNTYEEQQASIGV